METFTEHRIGEDVDMIKEGLEEYQKAVKLGKRAMTAQIAKKKNPYLKVLDENPEAVRSVMEYPLGLVQIPAERIVGTKTAGRGQAFASNFMPILGEHTEFATKWAVLCESHLKEGIHDAIVAYEYMNEFYVLEGNKRVSVLKYFDAVSIAGTVTRIVPYRTEDKANKIYYEFMDFYELSQINYVYFSEEGRFARLQQLIGKKADEKWTEEDRQSFSSVYSCFETNFRTMMKENEERTIGDAFLAFTEIYGYHTMERMTAFEMQMRIARSLKVFEVQGSEERLEIRMDPEVIKKPFLQRLLPISAPILKIAFVHEVDPHKSAWTYIHDLGRTHLEQAFSDQIRVSTYIAEQFENYEAAVSRAVEEGNTIIFTTSPLLYNASLKMALDHKEVKILNCSLMSDKGVIRNYNARIYEAKFILGAIAGAMTTNDRLGYLADYPIYGTVANINAFALGAQMINPRAKVYVEWESEKDIDYVERFREHDVSYVSGRNIIIPNKNTGSRHFGLYDLADDSRHNLAMPILHWGKFYEQMIHNIIEGNWKNTESPGSRSLNYWWGMSAGIVDVICSGSLPQGTQRLVELLKKTICEGEFNPFSGVLYSQNGIIQEEKEKTLTPEKIITMDWLCENVIGRIPKMSELTEHAKPVVMEQGIQGEVK